MPFFIEFNGGDLKIGSNLFEPWAQTSDLQNKIGFVVGKTNSV